MGSHAPEHYALLTDYDATSAYSQAFYTFFANLRSQWTDESHLSSSSKTKVHSLQITSASASKKHPAVAANLAIVAAQSGAETILIETDFRTPTLQQSFGLSRENGLGALLDEEAITPQKIASYLQPTLVPGLRLLGTGSPGIYRPDKLLSPHLAEVASGIYELLASSDKGTGIALFQSAPVQAGADAMVLGALTEQTILTVILGQTTRTQARQAQELLQQAAIQHASVILLHP